ncbi:MAG: DUF721 domain-containing protein [Paludibacteraceae bacterium]|nr:DUF721 domain-containing protein [Paludibacteraceae bacterium]
MADFHRARPITELLNDFLRDSGLEQPLLEQRLVQLWPEVVGQMAAQLTTRLEIRNGILYAYVRSAALKAELFLNRQTLVERLNERVGGRVIYDIRLLG